MERLRGRLRRVGRLGRLAALAVVVVAAAVGYHLYEESTHWSFEVMALDAHTGRVIWKRSAVLTTASRITASPPRVWIHGEVLHGAGDCSYRKVTATLDATTGATVAHARDPGGGQTDAGGSVTADGIDYRVVTGPTEDPNAPAVESYPVTLQAAVHDSRTELWRRQLGRRRTYGWTLSGSGDVVVVTDQHRIWAFSRAGHELWAMGNDGRDESYHVLASGDRVYVTRDGWYGCSTGD